MPGEGSAPSNDMRKTSSIIRGQAAKDQQYRDEMNKAAERGAVERQPNKYGTGRCHVDETGMRINGKNGYIRVCRSVDIVVFDVSHHRFSPVPVRFFPPEGGIMVVCDGYSAYHRYKARQCCWAHLLRESESPARGPEQQRLHEMPKEVFGEAKALKKSGIWGEARGRRICPQDIRPDWGIRSDRLRFYRHPEEGRAGPVHIPPV